MELKNCLKVNELSFILKILVEVVIFLTFLSIITLR